MPIAFEGQLYKDNYDLEMGRPIQPPEEKKKTERPDLTSEFNTQLSPAEQQDYNTKFRPQDSFDYDMQGWYKANPGADPKGEGVHYPDTFKKPNHMTFSRESQYSNDETLGGVWSQDNGQDVFTPSPYNLKTIGQDNLKEYFSTTEKNSRLDIPKRGVVDNLLGLTGERYQTWPEKALRSAIDAFTLPGDVMAGRVQPGSDEELTRAIGLAEMAVLGPAPIASRMADGTLGSFIGVKAKNFDKNALGGAQLMEKNGVSPDKIFEETGMFRGADNRWRSEIPDKDSKLTSHWDQVLGTGNEQVGRYLEDVLDHPELYKAYPQLRDVNVIYNPKTEGAYFIPSRNEIHTGPQFVDKKEIYLHEIQHVIQDIEGFNKGGAAAKNPKLRFEKEIDNLIEESQVLVKKKKDTGVLEDKDLDRLTYIEKVLSLNMLRKAAAQKEAEKNYWKLAGEVESRNVETRAILGKEHRRYYPPDTEDVPRAEQAYIPEAVWATPYGYTTDLNIIPEK